MPQSTSPFVVGLRAAAEQHAVAIHVGIHHPIQAGHDQPVVQKLLNRALYINAEGVIEDATTYDKLHVFDYGSLRESTTVQPGTRLTPPFDSPVGRIGSLICFDLRFPETAVALAQPGRSSPWADRPAQVLTYPSAFTLRTGEAHWETLLRARAIETQSWVVAAAQVGRHNERRASYGRSMVVDPWGDGEDAARGRGGCAGRSRGGGGRGDWLRGDGHGHDGQREGADASAETDVSASPIPAQMDPLRVSTVGTGDLHHADVAALQGRLPRVQECVVGRQPRLVRTCA